MEQQRSNNLLLGSQNMTGVGQSLSAQELQTFQAALAAEQARGNSYLSAAQIMAAPGGTPQAVKKKGGGKGIMGMIGTGVGAYFGGPQGAAMGGQIGSSLDS